MINQNIQNIYYSILVNKFPVKQIDPGICIINNVGDDKFDIGIAVSKRDSGVVYWWLIKEKIEIEKWIIRKEKEMK